MEVDRKLLCEKSNCGTLGKCLKSWKTVNQITNPIETASANSVESDLRCTSRVYFDPMTSQKPYQYNNKFYLSETNGYNIQQDALNEVYVFFQ